MEFQFNAWDPVFQDKIEIKDLGNFAIEASNDDGEFYYIIVRTLLGTTSIVTFGPQIPDLALLPHSFTFLLEHYEYKEGKLVSRIDKWLLDAKKKLTKAKLIDVEEAIDQFPDLKYYLENYNEDLY